MRYRRLDASGDYVFGGGQGDFWINQPEAVGQSILTRLMLWQGQWFYDLTEGTPWATEVLGERTQHTRDVVVRDRVLTTPGVREIVDYASAVNPNTRTFAAAVEVNTVFGGAQVALTPLPGEVPPLPNIAHAISIRGGLHYTEVAATPADLTQAGHQDITNFVIRSIDAGTY